MDKFKNRIKYYLIGFLIGVVAVAFFFGQRGCAWLPGNRVKSVIAENNIVVGDSVAQLLNCLSDDAQPIYDILNNSGDVNFGESETHLDHKIYLIEGENDLKVWFQLFESSNNQGYSEIIGVSSPNIQCKSTLSNQLKKPLVLPKKIIFSIIESHSFSYYPIIDCQATCYQIPLDSLETIHKKSKKIETPNIPNLINKVYIVNTEYQGKNYQVTYEIGENRTRIKQIQGENECDCEIK
ncbi:hypothetical protein DNU06_07110 [Putridiphycobacter roseus]|uniref:Uncharacterized protein n=1 Tax=Putridiphycobacter roseus TaxID=2219161 RepID=A0A2W1N1Z6_9FLAO|nr:hypothetical protein [Putridiphycobacter roseus]PZE17590.1 hypothetical protein DNU06_07110 [Putridiphycobacter roseus]